MWGLSFGMRDLQSSLQHANTLVAVRGIQFPDQGLNPGPLRWACGVLATGPSGKPLEIVVLVLNGPLLFATVLANWHCVSQFVWYYLI